MFNIFECLKPIYGEGKEKTYESMIKKYSLEKDLSVLWYPNGNLDFRSLYFSSKNSCFSMNLDGKPDLYIYSTMNSTYRYMIKNNQFIEQEKNGLTVNNVLELEYKTYEFPNIIYLEETIITDPSNAYGNNEIIIPLDKEKIAYKLNEYKVFLFDIELSDNQGSVPLLYFIWDDVTFLNSIISDKGLEVKYFQLSTAPAGNSYWDRKSQYLLFFLGLMKSKYLFLDDYHNTFKSSINIKAAREKVIEQIMEDKMLKNVFLNKKNQVLNFELIGETLKHYVPGFIIEEYFKIYKLNQGYLDSSINEENIDNTLYEIIFKFLAANDKYNNY